MDSLMKLELDREILRYAVSIKMFCSCGQVLDCKSAYYVEYTVKDVVRNFVTCSACYKRDHLPILLDATELKAEITHWNTGERPLTVKKPIPLETNNDEMTQSTLDI
jgi:hypothetical protein